VAPIVVDDVEDDAEAALTLALVLLLALWAFTLLALLALAEDAPPRCTVQ
jgi:hypothetical protein